MKNVISIFENANKSIENEAIKNAIVSATQQFVSVSQVLRVMRENFDLFLNEQNECILSQFGVNERKDLTYKGFTELLADELFTISKDGQRVFGLLREEKVINEIECYDKNGNKLVKADGTPIVVKLPKLEENGSEVVNVKWQACKTWSVKRVIIALAQSAEYKA